MDVPKVSLATVAAGAAPGLVNDALDRVVENIVDPATDPRAVREVTLRIRFKPEPGRDAVDVSVAVTTKTAPALPASSRAFVGLRHGRPVLVEAVDPKQPGLFDAKGPAAVAPLRREG